MWKLFVSIVLVCVGLSEQYKSIIPQNTPPGKTPYCVDELKGHKKVGDQWYDLEKCERRHCYTNSEGKTFIDISGCGTIMVSGNCKLVKPTKPKPYPDCCPHPVCE